MILSVPVNGYLFDVRSVPLVLAFLYAGHFVGILTTAGMLLFRLVVGGPDIYSCLAVATPLSLLLFFLAQRHRQLPRRRRYWVGMLAVSGYVSAILGFDFAFVPELRDTIRSWGMTFWLANAMIALMAIHLIEIMMERMRLREQAVQHEKLELTNGLAASIAHEVRNPLAVASGFSQLILKKGQLVGEDMWYVRVIRDELKRAEDILTEYLRFSRQSPPSLEVCNLGNLVHGGVQMVTPYAVSRNVDLRAEIVDDAWVRVDPAKFKQVLINLLKNAIESMPTGGDVRVSVRKLEQSVSISIQDSGVGMTEEQVKRLGSPFFSTKFSGTGLGLSVSYQLIAQMHGTIQVSSQPGRGTTFVIKLPVCGQEEHVDVNVG
jgi:two-component system, sporulation sensor kinase B